MKKTIAVKEHSVGIYCLSVTIIGMIGLILGLLLRSVKVFLLAFFPAVLGVIFTILYLSMPKDLIFLSDDEKSIVLPGNIMIPVDSIIDITYRNTDKYKREKKWGSVIFITDTKKYKVLFVDHCITVQEQLKQLVSEAKRH